MASFCEVEMQRGNEYQSYTLVVHRNTFYKIGKNLNSKILTKVKFRPPVATCTRLKPIFKELSIDCKVIPFVKIEVDAK